MRPTLCVVLCVMSASALLGCQDHVQRPDAPAPVAQAPAEPTEQGAAKPPAPPEEPAVEDKPDDQDPYAPTYGPRQTWTGVLEMDRLAGGKKLQATTLKVGGESYIISYRPVPDYYLYVGRRVEVTGRPYTNSPYVQSIGGTHLSVDSIKLAPGEQARSPAPTALPPAPRVTSLAQAAALGEGRWMEVVGEVASWRVDEHNVRRGALTLKLDDGALETARVHGIEVARGGEAPKVGERATVTAYVYEADGAWMIGHGAACAGEVSGCGIEGEETGRDGSAPPRKIKQEP